MNADRLLLEYDDHRSGSFDALEDVPDNKFVVLGLISTKPGRLESFSHLRSRVIEASGHFPFAQLALSTQCGFAPSVIQNPLGFEEQRQKLELVSRIARELWG